MSRKAAVAAPSPLGDAKMVELWIGDPPGRHSKSLIGTGYRRLVVVEIGDRAVQLVSASYLQRIKVDRSTFDRKAKPVACKPRKLAETIRANLEALKGRALEPGEGARRLAAGKAALRALKNGRA